MSMHDLPPSDAARAGSHPGRSRRPLRLAALLAVVVALTACGGSAAPTAQTAPAAATAATSRPTVAAGTAAGDTTAAPAPDTSATGAAGSEPAVDPGGCRGEASPVLCVTVVLSGAVSVVGDGVGDTFDTPKACGEWAKGTTVGDVTLRLMPSAFTVADHELGFDVGAEYPGPGTYDLADVAAVGDGQVTVDGRVFEHRRGATSTAAVTFVADGSGRLEFTGLVELGAAGNELSGSMRWTCGDARGT